jgi:serine/threonine-protein kinase
MAPEQVADQGCKGSPQTDVWALGVVLYELLTGHRPFPGPGYDDLTRQIRGLEPPSPSAVRPGLDRALGTIVLTCLEKNPAWRYASAEALADDLAR